MKKIYLLLAAVMMTLSSFAAPKFAASNMDFQLKDGAVELMQSAKFNFDQKINEGKVEPMRSWTDDQGVVWNAAILNAGGAWEMFTMGGEPITPEDLPIYVVRLKVSDYSGKHEYNVDLCWPSQSCFYDTKEEAIADLGEENLYNIAPFAWILNAPFEYDPEYPLSYLGVMDPQYFGTTCMYNGDDSYVIGSGLSLTFTDYDKDLNWVDFSLLGSLEGTPTKYISINYSGDAAIYGMEAGNKTYFNPGQVHIFNTGVMDYETSEWAWVYLTEFDPVTRYYVMFTANGYGYSDESGMPLELTYSDGTVAGTSFSETELPSVMPYQIAQDTDAFFCGFGALFAAEDSEKPYGRWTLPVGYEFDEDYQAINPANAYELLLGAWSNPISQQDGMCVVDQNYYYRNPQVDQTEFVIGDVNEGLRFTYYDNYDGLCDVQFKGDIFYHGNAEDYTEVTLLPAVGTESYYQGSVDTSVENIAMPETEKINVKVVGNSIVAPEGAEVYNLNGVRVNANELSNGLYIVKVGKNAVKVVL